LLCDPFFHTKLFLRFSEHEGVALPPKEAIGGDCVSFFCHSDMPQNYIIASLYTLFFLLNQPIDSRCHHGIEFVDDPNLWKKGLRPLPETTNIEQLWRGSLWPS